MSRSVVWSEEDYTFIAGGRRIHSVVMNVGMFEGVRVVRFSSVQVQVAVPGVSLCEVVVQHRPEGRQQQQDNRQQCNGLACQVLQGRRQ